MSSATVGENRPTPHVFISHSHEDADFCVKLVDALRARLGEDAVWYDASGGQHGLQGGEAWWDKIVAEITARPYFLVVLSPNAATSKWVSQEMGIAFRQHVELGKRLLPLRLAEAERRADWAGIQEFSFVVPRPFEQALGELLRALNVEPAQRVATPAIPAMSMPLTPQQALLERLTQEAHTAYGRERWSDTLDRTEALIARGAMIPALWRERASAALALGEASVALDAVEHALQADSDDVETLRLQARILLYAGQTPRAVEAMTLANALAPLDDAATRLPLLADLYDALVTQSRWSDALRRCDDALYLAPQDMVWLRHRVAALEGVGRQADALTVAQTLAARPDADASDSLTLARLFKWASAPDEAIRAALDSAASRAQDAPTHAQIAQARRELLPPPISVEGVTDTVDPAGGSGISTDSGALNRGENVEQPVELTLREACMGAQRLYTIRQPETCGACSGLGQVSGRACGTCGGTGIVERERRITVRIPAGVDTGTKVRVAGEGQPSATGGPRGDLYLLVTVTPHSEFERRGDDLIMEAQVPLTTAILGGELTLTLIDGKRITMTIPQETLNGQVFRVAGKGMPKPNSDVRGNLLVRMLVKLPQQLNEQERQFFEEMRRRRSTD